MAPLLPVSVDGSLPIQLETAPHDLCRKACAGRLKIKGSRWGIEEPEAVPIAADFLLIDFYEEREGYCWARIVDPASAIGQQNYNRRYTNYWKHLCVSAAECRACWPSATAPTKESAEALPPELDDAKTQGAPRQFLMWAVKEEAAHGVVKQNRAVKAMRTDVMKTKPPGRDRVIKWVRALPEEWKAKRGTPSGRQKPINPPASIKLRPDRG